MSNGNRMHWKLDREVSGTRIDVAEYHGWKIHRLRDVTGVWNDEYAIVNPATKKVETYATLQSAKRVIERTKEVQA